MQILRSLIVLILAFLCGCAHASRPGTDLHYRTVSLPHVKLATGERIASVDVELTGATITSVNHTPSDWSMAFDGPEDGVSTLNGYANHGVGWLSDRHELDDFFTILMTNPSAFTIKGTVEIASPNDQRFVSFSGSEFPMKPSPDKALPPVDRRGD